ncbi:c-type cytochrome [Flavobacterium haoranii]|uniref:Cytochrome c n=1 Tax=Flavobacterium haoranii TaxID=683124 RepID=A0A1M6EUU7_9FLAO|nr:c-type cytochrome [Flavobacterium haoranii]SHI89247.1 cytochrome c [Flavobacterium haoranii]
MKKLVFSLAILVLVSCGGKKEEEPFGKSKEVESVSVTEESVKDVNPLVEEGQKLFEGKGTCSACHQPENKVIGPSLKEISKIYTEKNGNIITFLKGEAEPIVDPSQFEVMKANFAITKNMTDEELASLEAYIKSF